MSYKWLRGLILWIPTVVIGLWEYARHAFLLPYVSMELGNLLAPIFVFLVTLTLLRPLFGKLEAMQESLKREQVGKSALEEREQLAQELHDGISQSLFMLSVKLDKLDRARTEEETRLTMEGIRHTVRHVYDNVRQSIASLQEPPKSAELAWLQSAHQLAEEMENASGTVTEVEWGIPESWLGNKEKVELLAIIREALMNIQKHAGAGHALIQATAERSEDGSPAGFRCVVEDNGAGNEPESLTAKGKYGVKMMRERASSMGWSLRIGPGGSAGTRIEITRRCSST
ncbi:histidine kinase [Paenibacillus sp. LHD-117]|uniref:sensor histidine kinase n=1 Tax=Paenibacillus sp. LHD-117 TaxID=3071412 RepID=UPI0027E02147|nr:histidine kinase [Paenibacillus sp. LHD-117]MDQ6423017.1 histidine kinase [Paenibacillus sp. LHD-117]